ncbi:MAG: hypothetical protein Q4D81_13570 [Eubacteriales bacterium]|nr:hypothetical protein [Eubacteriales bacterium]
MGVSKSRSSEEKWADLWNSGILSSGETTILEEEQQKFVTWMQNDDSLWDYELKIGSSKSMQEDLLQFVAEHIKSLPAYHFILRYFLMRYKLRLGDDNLKGLWNHIETGKWRVHETDGQSGLAALFKRIRDRLAPDVDGKTAALGKSDYNDILSALSAALRTEYPDELIAARLGKSGRWSTYFHALIEKPDYGKLQDVALALDWNWEIYSVFRMKALKYRGINFLEREDVLMFLTLKYARDCNLRCYPAFRALSGMYPQYANNMSYKDARDLLPTYNEESSARVGELLQDTLEHDGRLAAHYRSCLFNSPDNDLEKIFRNLQLMRAAKITRSFQEAFHEQWNIAAEAIIRGDFTDADSPRQMRHEIFRYLYGGNVEKLVVDPGTNNRRIADLPDKYMISLAPAGVTDYFLDSREFLNTRIRDEDFYRETMTTDQARQRNLLLTLVFLHYQSRCGEVSSYEERLSNFDFEATDLLESCGFLSLHSGYAYDAFLKLLLACEYPLDLFQFIWYKKTGSVV